MCSKGFEPPTHGLEGRCSIQLSYEHIVACLFCFTTALTKDILSHIFLFVNTFFASFFIFFTNIFYADFSPIFSFVYCILLLKRI